MLIHSVFFWLKPETTPALRAAMQQGLESLRAIQSAESVYIGIPAALPDRPVRDSSYAFALTVLFKDIAAHDAYQVDPLHKTFIQDHQPIWSRVQVYDAV
jgi:Stress responsive A/B Barrel Domain